MRTLVFGGARSGKSSWAEHELLTTAATSTGGASDAATSTVLRYIATARPWPGDSDFHSRVEEHRIHRQAQAREHEVTWHTVDDVDAVDALASPKRRMLLDNVGTWLTYITNAQEMWEAPKDSVAPWTRSLVDAARDFPADSSLFIMSPEIGFDVIPEHRSGWLFRDEIGLLNQQLAAVCDCVVLVVTGCPTEVKAAS